MSFDFLSSFKDLSNDDLIEVVLRENDYTPEATGAALNILQQRGFSSSQIEAGIQARQSSAIAAELSPEQFTSELAGLGSRTNSLGLTTAETVWYAVFTFTAIWFGPSVYFFFFQLFTLGSPEWGFGLQRVLQFIEICLIGSALFYLSFRHRHGWMLLVILCSTELARFILSIGRLLDSTHIELSIFITPLINLSLLLYVTSKPCMALFPLQPTDRKKSILIGAGLGLALGLARQYLRN